MSTNKDLVTGLCSGTLVLTNRFTSNRQPADWTSHYGWVNVKGAENMFKGQYQSQVVNYSAGHSQHNMLKTLTNSYE